jgi:predicted amidohydrolase
MSRPVRILSLSVEGAGGIPENIARYGDRLARHRGFRPDLIVFPEGATSAGSREPVKELAESEDGPSMTFYRSVAKDFRAWVVGGHYREGGPEAGKRGSAFNAASLIDREGKCIGTYRKTWPTGSEYTGGVIPGPQDQPVFPTEFGPVGIAICFDIGFPGIWESYGRQGARIVVWPSAYPGGAVLNGYAVLHGYYIVTASHDPGMRVIDPLGRDLAVASYREKALEATIDLDEAYVHMDYANLVVGEMRVKYGRALSIEAHDAIGWYRIVRTGDGPELRDILKEYGLQSCRDYYARARAAVDRHRETGDGPPWEKAWR